MPTAAPRKPSPSPLLRLPARVGRLLPCSPSPPRGGTQPPCPPTCGPLWLGRGAPRVSVCVSCTRLSVLGGHGVQTTRRTGQPVAVGVHGCVRVACVTVGVFEGHILAGGGPLHSLAHWALLAQPRPRVRGSGLRPARMGPQLCRRARPQRMNNTYEHLSLWKCSSLVDREKNHYFYFYDS